MVIRLFLGAAAERVLIVFLIAMISVLGMEIYSGNSGILSFGHLSFMVIREGIRHDFFHYYFEKTYETGETLIKKDF